MVAEMPTGVAKAHVGCGYNSVCSLNIHSTNEVSTSRPNTYV